MTRKFLLRTIISVGLLLQMLSVNLCGADHTGIIKMNQQLSISEKNRHVKGSDATHGEVNLIPLPVKVENHRGVFRLRNTTKLVFAQENAELADLFSSMLNVPTGFSLDRTANSNRGIHFVINRTFNNTLGNEGYILDVKPSRIDISANKPAGLFYGMQTLMQLLPQEIESPVRTMQDNWVVPCLKIIDYPRFGWRGLMLDVSRHFFPKEMVIKYIDQLAKYKLNVFHWHLTDDQGWRIEIKSLPKLTEIGAWRAPRMGLWWTQEPQAPGEEPTYGGYYTQEDIREVVRYAQQRFVTIVPEIDVPGHSLAALAAYPELSCTGGPFHVNVGNNFYRKEDNALCPGNEQTFEFMDKVLGEVATLFPGEYIHIGGDECFKGFWSNCEKCKKRMSDEKLKAVGELQSYFVKRMVKIVQSKNKKLLGWDEILEGGLATEATVMSWRGMQNGLKAAKMNHHVVMTPTTNCYLDLYQGDPAIEPPTYSMLTLSSCYDFDPVPKGISDSTMILGGQGNLWTEAVPNYRHAEYMTWPRAMALAEVFWSQKQRKNRDNFIHRTEQHLKRFDQRDINYARSFYDAIIQPYNDKDGSLKIKMDTEIDGLNLYYSFDNAYPDHHSTLYRKGESLAVPLNAAIFRVITYRDNKPIGRMITVSLQELGKRVK